MYIPKAVKPPVRRTDLEYPTEDVDFFWWVVIGKAKPCEINYYTNYKTFMSVDDFTDKRIFGYASYYAWADWLEDTVFKTEYIYYELGISQRVSPDWANAYMLFVRIRKYFLEYDNPTEELVLYKRLNWDYYYLGHSATQKETGWDMRRRFEFECVGSSLKCFLEGTEVISATDTDLTAGKLAVYGELPPISISNFLVFKTASGVEKTKAIIELNVVGSGKREDPYRPEIPKELERKISWGSFDFKGQTSTVLILVKKGEEKDIEKVVEQSRRKGLRYLKPPKDYGECVKLYKKLSSKFNFLAGKDDFAYQILGLECLEYFSVADFYYGNIIEHKKGYNQIRKVRDQELRRILQRYIHQLQKVNVLTEERDKHINKLKKVLSIGW